MLLDLLTTAQRMQNHVLVVGAHIRLATYAIQTNDLSVARTQLEDALVLAEEVGDTQAQAEVLWNLAQFHALYSNAPISVTYGERAVALAQERDMPVLLANCCAALGAAYIWSGRFPETVALSLRGHEVIQSAMQYFPWWRCVIVPWQCALAVLQGEWKHAEALALLAREVRREVGTPLVLQDFVRWYETETLLRSGHVDLARADVAEFALLVGANRRHRIVLLRMQAVLVEHDGEIGHALEYLREAAQLAEGRVLACMPAL